MFSGVPLYFLERRLHYSYEDIKQENLVLSLFYKINLLASFPI